MNYTQLKTSKYLVLGALIVFYVYIIGHSFMNKSEGMNIEKTIGKKTKLKIPKPTAPTIAATTEPT